MKRGVSKEAFADQYYNEEQAARAAAEQGITLVAIKLAEAKPEVVLLLKR
jgi:hypothetical protein